MRIKKSGVVAAAAMLLSMAALSGCGGGGGGGGSTSNNASPFAGTYSGEFDFSGSNNQSGTINFTVGSDGHLSGQVHNATYNLDGTVSGTIDSSGNTNQTYVYPSNGTYTATGKLLTSSSGYLSGQLEEFSGSTDIGALDISVRK